MIRLKRFLIRIGARTTHISEHIIRRALHHPKRIHKRNIRRLKHLHKKAKAAPMTPMRTLTSIAFPIASVGVLIFTIYSDRLSDYVVDVSMNGVDIGTVHSEAEFNKARCGLSEFASDYDINSDTYGTAKITVHRASSAGELTDRDGLYLKMTELVADSFELRKTEEEPNDIDLILAELPDISPDEDLVTAFVIKADNRIVGFTDGFDEIDEALEDYKKRILSSFETDGRKPSPDDVTFDKNIILDETYEINKNAVVTQDKIISILTGNTQQGYYYEVKQGDTLWRISDETGMSVDMLKACRATYNGQTAVLGDNIRIGTLIELTNTVPYLNLVYDTEETEELELPYKTIDIEDSSLYIGQKEIRTTGENGRQQITTRITNKLIPNDDGTYYSEVLRKKTIRKETISEPVTEVKVIGTAVPLSGRGTNAGSGDYFWPVDGGYISSTYGGDRHHKGLDIAAPLGTPIYAAANGTVTSVGSGWGGGYGNHIIIQNDDGNVCMYAHMSATDAELGSYVTAGDVIGYVGSTGDSTGNHLHFEVRCDGLYYDPQDFVAQ